MHPALSAFPNSVFYEGTLRDGVTEDKRTGSVSFPWPNPKKPMFFYSIVGQEEIADNGVTFLNRREAMAIADILTRWVCANTPLTSLHNLEA